MIDKNSRNINYLRISVTDMCNLRCIYCRPKEGLALMDRDEILTFEEICAVVGHAVKLGITRFRITGGEPLARKGIERLISSLSRIPGIEELAMTTNGILLKEFAARLKRSGLSRINISLDTLDKERYADITRGGDLDEVFKGIEEAIKIGFANLKINMVLMAGINDDEIEGFARLTLERDLEVRFIEFMSSRNKKMLNEARFLPIDLAIKKLKRMGNLVPLFDKSGNGPAKRFRIEGARGSLGFIDAVSSPFCGNCNRLRLTADGKLRSCLLAGGEVDIKSILRSVNHRLHNIRSECPSSPIPVLYPLLSRHQEIGLTDAFSRAVDMKPRVHSGATQVLMYQVGG